MITFVYMVVTILMNLEVLVKVEEVDYTSKLSNEDINKYRLAKGEIIPVVYK